MLSRIAHASCSSSDASPGGDGTDGSIEDAVEIEGGAGGGGGARGGGDVCGGDAFGGDVCIGMGGGAKPEDGARGALTPGTAKDDGPPSIDCATGRAAGGTTAGAIGGAFGGAAGGAREPPTIGAETGGTRGGGAGADHTAASPG